MNDDYTVSWSEEDASFVAKCNSFPFVSAHGDTEDSAIVELKIAIEAVLDLLDSVPIL